MSGLLEREAGPSPALAIIRREVVVASPTWIALAPLELTTALTGLLERFPRLRPAADDVTWLPNRVLCTVPELPVAW